MELVNHTMFPAAWIPGIGPERTLGISVIIKGTFRVSVGGSCESAGLQLPLFEADQFPDEDSTAAVVVESDYVLYKPRTDVVVLGKAQVPSGEPVQSCEVSVAVGKHTKRVRAFGDRVWRADGSISAPAAFTAMPLRFELAYGGHDPDPDAEVPDDSRNPVGKGYFTDAAHAPGTSLPNLEDPDALFTSPPNAAFRPAPQAFAWYGRAWEPRRQLVGSVEPGAKDLPPDFDWAFLNGAHPDLQLPYLRGDEPCGLTNCTPSGQLGFSLPGIHPRFTVLDTSGVARTHRCTLDTVVMLAGVALADAQNTKRHWTNALYLVWRAHFALEAGRTPASLRKITVEPL